MHKTIFSYLILIPCLMSAVNNKLKPCPPSPNCVCTIANEVTPKKMETLIFSGSLAEAKAKLKSILGNFKRTTLIEEEEHYLHFTFVTALGGFTDDVEFYFAAAEKKIHFRSASRVGYSDLGANKRRMKKITKRWKAN